MIKPPPIKVICKDCGYQKVFAPHSDALMPGEYNHQFCTKCGSNNIKVTNKISIFDKVFITLCKCSPFSIVFIVKYHFDDCRVILN